MPVLDQMPVQIDPVALLRALNRGRVPAPLREAAEQAAARAENLIAAAALWEWFTLRAVESPAVFVARDPVSDPVRLEIGPHADLLAAAPPRADRRADHRRAPGRGGPAAAAGR